MRWKPVHSLKLSPATVKEENTSSDHQMGTWEWGKGDRNQGHRRPQTETLGAERCPVVRFPSSAWSFGHVQFIATPRTVARQAPLSMEFSREEYWRGLPFPLRLWGNRGLEADGNLIWVNTGGETGGDFRDGSRRGPSVARFWVRGDQVKCQEITGKWGAPTDKAREGAGTAGPRASPSPLASPLNTGGRQVCSAVSDSL